MTQPSPQFRELLTGVNSTLTLDLAALELASIDNPDLDRDAALRTLDEWAAAIGARVSQRSPGAQYLSAANGFLFGELGLRGANEDYYAPANSCLDQVLLSRRGCRSRYPSSTPKSRAGSAVRSPAWACQPISSASTTMAKSPCSLTCLTADD